MFSIFDYDGKTKRVSSRRRPARGKSLVAQRPAGYRGSMGFPWIAPHLNALAKSKQVAIPMSPFCSVAVLGTTGVAHGYGSLRELVTACYSAVQGSAGKSIGGAATAGTALTVGGVALSAAVYGSIAAATASNGTGCWGWICHIGSSVTNWASRPIQIDVGPITGAAGPVQDIVTPVLSLAVTARRIPCDILILSPSDGGGRFAIKPGAMNSGSGASGTSTFNGICARSNSDTNVFVSFESLSARDLMSAVVNGEAPPVMDNDGNVFDGDFGSGLEYELGAQSFPGIHDEDNVLGTF